MIRSRSTSRSKTRTKSRTTRAPSRTRTTRFRTARTTSRYAKKARAPMSRAKVRRTSLFPVNRTITRTQKPQRQTNRSGLIYDDRLGYFVRPPPIFSAETGIRPRITQTQFNKPRTPRTIFKSSVWSKHPPQQLRVKTKRNITARIPTKINRRTPLYEPRNITLGQNMGINPMLDPKQRYLRPMEKDIFPRPQYQAFADNEPTISDRLAGVLPQGTNMQSQINNLMSSPLIWYAGAGIGILIILKVVL